MSWDKKYFSTYKEYYRDHTHLSIETTRRLSKKTHRMAESSRSPVYSTLEHDTLVNTAYRRVYWTSPDGKMQIVLMSLKPHESIGMESHASDQFFRIEKGVAKIQSGVGGLVAEIGPGDMFAVPGGTTHNVTALAATVKLYTIYTPMNHLRGLIQQDRPPHD